MGADASPTRATSFSKPDVDDFVETRRPIQQRGARPSSATFRECVIADFSNTAAPNLVMRREPHRLNDFIEIDSAPGQFARPRE